MRQHSFLQRNEPHSCAFWSWKSYRLPRVKHTGWY
jgi:hypothetical protein